MGRVTGGPEGGPGQEGAAAGGGHGLHYEKRIQVPPCRLQVPERRRDPDIAAGCCSERIYALFSLQASDVRLKYKEALMEIKEDGSTHKFIEVPMENEMVRITYIEHSWPEEQSGIRIQIREINGHLRRGPEIPVDIIGDAVSAVINLLKN